MMGCSGFSAKAELAMRRPAAKGRKREENEGSMAGESVAGKPSR
jgi:hypothetical protein